MTRPYLSVHDHLRQRAEEHADRTFLVSIGQGSSITFGEFGELTDRFARLLEQYDLGPDDRVSILAENSIESVVAYFGVQRHGSVVNPVNIRVNEASVEQILGDVAPALVVYAAADRELAERVRRAAPAARWVEYGALDDPDAPDGSLFRLLAALPEGSSVRPVDDLAAPAIIAHTSGTSATPKGVIHSRGSLHSSTEASIELVAMTDADRLLEFRDISWLSPQVLTLAATVATGATAVLAPTFSRSQFFEWLAAHRITVAVGVPSVINMLLEQAGDDPVDASTFPDLRFMTSSTAPLSVERHREFEAAYGIEILQYMGMSEAGWIAGNRPGHRKIGTVGPAAPFQHLRIRDTEGHEVGPGVEGEIIVGGAQLAIGYLLDGDIVPLDDRDALATGDLGKLDEDGYLTVTGRLKDIIIRGGVNIAPLEITTVLHRHPAVAEAAAVGVPDPIYGEAIAAFVELRSTASVDDLMDHCRQQLSAYKVPATIHIVDALARTERGKVDTAALRDLWQGLAGDGEVAP